MRATKLHPALTEPAVDGDDAPLRSMRVMGPKIIRDFVNDARRVGVEWTTDTHISLDVIDGAVANRREDIATVRDFIVEWRVTQARLAVAWVRGRKSLLSVRDLEFLVGPR